MINIVTISISLLKVNIIDQESHTFWLFVYKFDEGLCQLVECSFNTQSIPTQNEINLR